MGALGKELSCMMFQFPSTPYKIQGLRRKGSLEIEIIRERFWV